jgi:hypothetical protein
MQTTTLIVVNLVKIPFNANVEPPEPLSISSLTFCLAGGATGILTGTLNVAFNIDFSAQVLKRKMTVSFSDHSQSVREYAMLFGSFKLDLYSWNSTKFLEFVSKNRTYEGVCDHCFR